MNDEEPSAVTVTMPIEDYGLMRDAQMSEVGSLRDVVNRDPSNAGLAERLVEREAALLRTDLKNLIVGLAGHMPAVSLLEKTVIREDWLLPKRYRSPEDVMDGCERALRVFEKGQLGNLPENRRKPFLRDAEYLRAIVRTEWHGYATDDPVHVRIHNVFRRMTAMVMALRKQPETSYFPPVGRIVDFEHDDEMWNTTAPALKQEFDGNEG